MVFSVNLNHRHENHDDHHDGNQEHLLHGVSLLASDAHQCSPLQIFSSSSTGLLSLSACTECESRLRE